MDNRYRFIFVLIALAACYSEDDVIGTLGMIAVAMWLGIFIYEQAFEEWNSTRLDTELLTRLRLYKF